MKKCEHKEFIGNFNIARLEDSKGFMAEMTVKCAECDEPFKFLGLPLGLNMHGAAVDPTLTEARIAIAPLSESEKKRYKVMQGVSGFNIKTIN